MSENYADTAEGADYVIIASHSGLVPDLAMLDFLGTNGNILFMIGAHDHLTLRQDISNIPYMHNGFRGEMLNVAEVWLTDEGAEVVFKDVLTSQIGVSDAGMEKYIADARSTYLEEADLEVLGNVPNDMSVLEGAMWAVETVRDAVGADIAFLNHTSFGSGLSSGPLQRYRFDQFMRFDNDVMKAEIDSDTLKTILAGCNQHNQQDLSKRTGDFLYSNDIKVEDGKMYTIATSSWVALDFNQMNYLGVQVKFEKVPDITTKAILVDDLNK